MRKIVPSLHFLENFMPIFSKTSFMLTCLQKAAKIPFYQAVELGFISDVKGRQEVRKIVEARNWQETQWVSPVIAERGLSLSSLNAKERQQAVQLAKELIAGAVEAGATRVGLQSGPDLGDDKRDEAKKALTESCLTLAEEAKQFSNLFLLIEPLDRYVHKKQLLGPVAETVAWFDALKKDAPNFFIHWDSAHEKLGDADLLTSMKLAAPHMAQFHICNCVDVPDHPYYGDFHMDVGQAPDYQTWGYLTPEIGASMLKLAQSFAPLAEIPYTTCALEVRAHLGDDLWAKERLIRQFLMKTFDLAGIAYNV